MSKFAPLVRTGLLGLSLSAALAVPGAFAADKIVFGTVVKLALQWPLYVALEKGYLAKENVEVDIVTAGGSSKAVQQTAAGSINIGEAGMPDLIRGIEKGAPIKLIAFEVAQPIYRLLAKPEIKKLEGLAGKKIIIGGSKDITLVYLQAMLKPHGLTKGGYDLIYAGSTANRYAALKSGGVDAAILTSPFDFRAIGEGYTNLGHVHDYLPDFPFTAYGVNTEWAAKNRRAIVGLLKAYDQGLQWVYDPANKDEAIDIVMKHVRGSREDLAKTYDEFFVKLKVFRTDGRMPQEDLNKVLEALVELGDLEKPLPPRSKFVDDSYLKEAVSR